MTTDKEKIIAEIERLYNEEAERFDTSQEIGAKRILDKLSNFINSFPAEQPNEDLEKVSKNYADNEVYGDDAYFAIKAAFIAGAQWQKKQMMRAAIDALVDEDAENVGKKTLLLIGEQRNALNTQLSNYEYGETVKLVIIKEGEQ